MLPGDPVRPPPVRAAPEGRVVPADPLRHVFPVPGSDAYWFEISDAGGNAEACADRLAPILGAVVEAEGETLRLAKELADRLEEIELLYTISQVLGRTIRLETAAEIIAREVADVVGARRASIFVYDEATNTLQPVAGVGRAAHRLTPIPVDHPTSIAARVFREGRMVCHDPRQGDRTLPISESGQHYLGDAFLSVPIIYPTPGGDPRPVGVINLTNRSGTDAFSDGEQRLVAAVANQIATAIENARLVERDLARSRVSRELELAHDLQLKLLPSPLVLGAGVDLAARCLPAHSIGGDFYYFVRLGGGRVGVMLGDVSSSGFGAALIMALVLSAAGIHADEAHTPDETLRRILRSVGDELAETEMHLSLVYAVVDPGGRCLRYANAGLPHAFRLQYTGEATRLAATAPPLGLADPQTLGAATLPWEPERDRLILFSDGVADARNATGERFGDERVLEIARQHRDARSGAVLEAVWDALRRHQPLPPDDQAIVILR